MSQIKLEISISEKTYRELERQLEMIGSSDDVFKNFKNINSVEELIVSYLEQLTMANDQLAKIEDQMKSVFKTMEEKGIDLNNLFSGFAAKKQEEKPVKESPAEEDKKMKKS